MQEIEFCEFKSLDLRSNPVVYPEYDNPKVKVGKRLPVDEEPSHDVKRCKAAGGMRKRELEL